MAPIPGITEKCGTCAVLHGNHILLSVDVGGEEDYKGHMLVYNISDNFWQQIQFLPGASIRAFWNNKQLM